ncbi:UDP-N-acetylmuramoyl-tripeptide--D-alanyl-D-alanine ligase [Anaeromyxobacter oryzisoli]|uniref:UDP-N-acetylmuramoyl-tripeptide--D-alanyl-D- alanine ligase n=1 Tax=Anaeromyxobacter oryzisoli TaxID=2925408 RepID=UPI001F57277C|nr:UDP-N-acetylmuramoyl-tripeptide--D-alanyl-D-alanine ligase [Anaeromyxobacter sp. SG63]
MTLPTFTPDELAAATGGRWIGAPPATLAGVSTDTRTVAAGNLFVALRGERFDAHDYLAEAAAKGAAAAVVAEAWAAAGRTPPLPALAVPDTLAALGAIARLHRRRFSIPFVGVTGSNGKTTTREMIAAILATRGGVLKTEGNLNNEVGVPLTLLRLDASHASAVIEMGMSHPGEIARLAAIAEPQVGVVTLAAPAHLEGLGTVEAVADAKAELYQGLPDGGIAVANADDPRMLKRAVASGRRMLTFASGRGRRGDVAVLEILSQGDEGLRFVLGIGNREVPVHIPALVGAHNAANAAAAAAAAIALGCTDREIARGLAAVKPVGRRLRLETLASGLRLLDDCYNANPASMSAALRTVVALAGGAGARPVAVLGDMLELGAFEAEAHRALGEEAARAGIARLAAFGPRARATAEAARAAGLEAFHTEEPDALVAWARAELRPSSDVLLVKGSRGMKLERLVEALR